MPGQSRRLTVLAVLLLFAGLGWALGAFADEEGSSPGISSVEISASDAPAGVESLPNPDAEPPAEGQEIPGLIPEPEAKVCTPGTCVGCTGTFLCECQCDVELENCLAGCAPLDFRCEFNCEQAGNCCHDICIIGFC